MSAKTKSADWYRMYAKLAADMAGEMTDIGHRAKLLEMAQVWQKLADDEEKTRK